VYFGAVLLVAISSAASAMGGAAATDTTGIYDFGTPSADGIGKIYMGREIAQVMGHEGARWLERPEREEEERPDLVLRAMTDLGIPSDAVVADIGCGSGYYTFRLAQLVPDGEVLAVDIQVESLELIAARRVTQNQRNVRPVLGSVDDPKLPVAGVDLVLMVDAYHEFSHPREMMVGIVRALKPAGRVVLVEYRAEDPEVRIKPLHKMTEAQAAQEMAAVGLELVESVADLPQHHLLVFGRLAR
jgi:SAM-dependent methyltransferase